MLFGRDEADLYRFVNKKGRRLQTKADRLHDGSCGCTGHATFHPLASICFFETFTTSPNMEAPCFLPQMNSFLSAGNALFFTELLHEPSFLSHKKVLYSKCLCLGFRSIELQESFSRLTPTRAECSMLCDDHLSAEKRSEMMRADSIPAWQENPSRSTLAPEELSNQPINIPIYFISWLIGANCALRMASKIRHTRSMPPAQRRVASPT